MGGLRNICKLYGGMTIKDATGTKEYIWDYTKDEPRLKSEMTSAEFEASEKAKWELLKNKIKKT